MASRLQVPDVARRGLSSVPRGVSRFPRVAPCRLSLVVALCASCVSVSLSLCPSVSLSLCVSVCLALCLFSSLVSRLSLFIYPPSLERPSPIEDARPAPSIVTAPPAPRHRATAHPHPSTPALGAQVPLGGRLRQRPHRVRQAERHRRDVRRAQRDHATRRRPCALGARALGRRRRRRRRRRRVRGRGRVPPRGLSACARIVMIRHAMSLPRRRFFLLEVSLPRNDSS